MTHTDHSGKVYDVLVVGGGPSGATAAHDLARQGHTVLLMDKAGRTKPCGGAIPPRLIKDFDIPGHLLVAHATSARMISPTDQAVDIPINNGFVGMVDRDQFDEWLRVRATDAGAERCTGTFDHVVRGSDGLSSVTYRSRHGKGQADTVHSVRARCIIGADGAQSEVAKQTVRGAERGRFVFAYHEIIRKPAVTPAGYDGSRCDVYYQGQVSPDFYGWVFPHGDTLSIGTGSADKGFSLRGSVAALRQSIGLAGAETLRREGAPIPMKPLPRWDNGRDVVLAGDAAGVVAPASGEGIYYAMLGGRLAADAAQQYLKTGDARKLALARKNFMREHGRVFWVLGVMQYFWYRNDRRRERFVAMCRDRDVQQLTFDAYMNKRLVRAKPMAHVRIFFKDMAHLLGLVRA